MTDWDERHGKKALIEDEPAVFLKENLHLLPPGRALDLAMGRGGNSIFLAEKGYEVLGIDRSVLTACCEHAGISMPDVRFECTVQQARLHWETRSAKLPDVCKFLGIALNHHDALSDTLACAKIMIEALSRH